MRVCARCGAKVDHTSTVGRNLICSNCSAYLHSCVNCRFYRAGRHNDCTEPQAELVADKRAANFCDFFTMREARGSKSKKGDNKRDQARKDFDKLFGG